MQLVDKRHANLFKQFNRISRTVKVCKKGFRVENGFAGFQRDDINELGVVQSMGVAGQRILLCKPQKHDNF